jgi:hypothetical protein
MEEEPQNDEQPFDQSESKAEKKKKKKDKKDKKDKKEKKIKVKELYDEGEENIAASGNNIDGASYKAGSVLDANDDIDSIIQQNKKKLVERENVSDIGSAYGARS